MRLEIIGLPAPQGSKTRMPNGALVDGTSKTGRANLQEWRRAVADTARAHLQRNPRPPFHEPLRLGISYRFPPTKSDPHRFWHATKPDIDKIVRSTLDALTHAGLIADDCIVASLTVTKRYARSTEPAGCTIDLESLASDEATIRTDRKLRARERRHRAKTNT